MKFAIIGMGSIGKRHYGNFRRLYPNSQIVVADPSLSRSENAMVYSDWRLALGDHPDANGALVCSPTEFHMEQLEVLYDCNIPFFCEKPPASTSQLTRYRLALPKFPIKSCIGFCYRYNVVTLVQADTWRQNGNISFAAQEDLIGRYGPDTAVMSSHTIDLALWLFGPALKVDLKTDGRTCTGHIQHEHGESNYDLRIDRNPRQCTFYSDDARHVIEPDDAMYRRELTEWVTWLKSTAAPTRLATPADGLAVLEVLAQCQTL